MSAQKSTKLFSNKTVLKSGMNIFMDQTQRLFGTAVKPQAVANVEHRVTRKTPAGLTARSPYPLTQAMSGAKNQQQQQQQQQQVRPLPTHQHSPYTLMPPMRSVEPSKLQYQNEILNGLWRSFESEEQCGSNCILEENGRQLQKLMDLMEEQKRKDQRTQDLEDDMWSSAESRLNLKLEMPTISKRSMEQRQAAKRVVAKELGPPQKPEALTQKKPRYGHAASPSATYLLAARRQNSSTNFERLREAPRTMSYQQYKEPQRPQKPASITFRDSSSTPPDMTTRKKSVTNILPPDVAPPKRTFPKPGNVSITNPTDMTSRKPESIMNTVRPDYGNVAQLMRNMPSTATATATATSSSKPIMITRKKCIFRNVQPANGDAISTKYPVNVVRPDIPPTSFSTQHSQCALNLQRAREERLEQSTKSHKQRICDFVLNIATFKRR